MKSLLTIGDRRGRDRMVAGFTSTYAICAYHQWSYEFKSRLSGRTINKEFNTMIMDWLHWLEDDNFFLIFFMKQYQIKI
jgi:hypothetical protein